MTLKIEVGRYYRTRDDHKARIYALDGDEGVVHGAIWFDAWRMVSWDANGYYYVDSETESLNDLVAEWDEPKDMTFEVGQYYRTRKGNVAVIYSTNGLPAYPIHGAVRLLSGEWESITWTEKGKFAFFSDKNDNDLVGRWDGVVEDTWPTLLSLKDSKTKLRIKLLLERGKFNSVEELLSEAVDFLFDASGAEEPKPEKSKVSLDKRYKTRNGIDVTIYSVAAKGPEPVHGCIHTPHGDLIASWRVTGQYNPLDESDSDLVEVEE